MFIVILGEKPGLVVRAEGSCPRGLNPAIYWMDVSHASYCIFSEKEIGSQMGCTKKIFKKT
jgi:hypothetical protein